MLFSFWLKLNLSFLGFFYGLWEILGIRYHELAEGEKEAWKFFCESTRNIEVLHNGLLQRVYFRVEDEVWC